MADNTRAALTKPEQAVLENRFPSSFSPGDHLDATLRRAQLVAEFLQEALDHAEFRGDDFRPAAVTAVAESIRLEMIDVQALVDADREHRLAADVVLTRLEAHRVNQGRNAG